MPIAVVGFTWSFPILLDLLEHVYPNVTGRSKRVRLYVIYIVLSLWLWITPCILPYSATRDPIYAVHRISEPERRHTDVSVPVQLSSRSAKICGLPCQRLVCQASRGFSVIPSLKYTLTILCHPAPSWPGWIRKDTGLTLRLCRFNAENWADRRSRRHAGRGDTAGALWVQVLLFDAVICVIGC